MHNGKNMKYEKLKDPKTVQMSQIIHYTIYVDMQVTTRKLDITFYGTATPTTTKY